MEEHNHIASAFDRDLEDISANLMRMGGLVEDSIQKAVEALKTEDENLAGAVREGDKQIDALEDLINEECARVIALRQPIARDLRLVLSVVKIASNLERVGDYAKNLAKRAVVLAHMPPVNGANKSLHNMVDEVLSMLANALDAFAQRDPIKAESVRYQDVEVDQTYNGLFREFLELMGEDSSALEACMHYHFIAKNIERMGDHVTNIAEQVIYITTGEYPEEARPKDTALFTPDGE